MTDGKQFSPADYVSWSWVAAALLLVAPLLAIALVERGVEKCKTHIAAHVLRTK